MNSFIKKAIENGRLILLLGAGASITSKDRHGNYLLLSDDLAEQIAQEAGWEYKGENLPTVYSAAKRDLKDRLDVLLEGLYKHCSPSNEFITIANHTWPRIYTLNIDDAFERALDRYSPQLINVRHRFDKIVDQDQLFKELDYIKINGSIDRLRDGLIFSSKEYGDASANPPLWYRELAHDSFRYTFLFIGTKLDEPLFYHQIERHMTESHATVQKCFVLTPSATVIEKESLLSYNLEHISGSLLDFSMWLDKNFSPPLKPTDVAIKRSPALEKMLSLIELKERERYADIFKDVTLVNRLHLSSQTFPEYHDRRIRQFYRGFKPQWRDILDEVPAEIRATKTFYNKVEDSLNNENNLVVVYGPAGSGKKTLLMQVALQIADRKNLPVYFLNEPVDNLEELISELEKISENRYCIFFDRLEAIASELRGIIKAEILKKGLFVGSERQHRWHSVVKEHLAELCSEPFQLDEINKSDADLILSKLEKFGPWTRLSKMKYQQRIDELYTKSKRQLLIGLSETTFGEGYEKIIENEYLQLGESIEKQFLIIVGLATIHRYTIQESFVIRALSNLGFNANVLKLSKKLSGIIHYKQGRLMARHPVYVKHLFDSVIDIEVLYSSLKALLSSYTVFEAPVIKRLHRKDGNLFKALFNHRYLKYLFRDNYDYVLGIYQTFEKSFENDGLFWLQSGLASRSFGRQTEAFEKLMTAYEAHPQSHTEHALAQQEMIIARATSKSRAYDLLEKAKIRLEGLDRTLKSSSTYPIVTLSEGHTEVIRVHEGDEKARELARQYANIIQGRLKDFGHDTRLKEAWTKLTTYAVTGEWVEDEPLPFL